MYNRSSFESIYDSVVQAVKHFSFYVFGKDVHQVIVVEMKSFFS